MLWLEAFVVTYIFGRCVAASHFVLVLEKAGNEIAALFFAFGPSFDFDNDFIKIPKVHKLTQNNTKIKTCLGEQQPKAVFTEKQTSYVKSPYFLSSVSRATEEEQEIFQRI